MSSKKVVPVETITIQVSSCKAIGDELAPSKLPEFKNSLDTSLKASHNPNESTSSVLTLAIPSPTPSSPPSRPSSPTGSVRSIKSDISLSLEDLKPDKKQEVGVLGAVMALIQSALGSGILTLPYALSQSGVLAGGVLMVLAMALNAYSSILIVRVGEQLNRRNFGKMAMATLGPCYAKFISYTLVIDALLKVIGLLVISKNLLPHALRTFFG